MEDKTKGEDLKYTTPATNRRAQLEISKKGESSQGGWGAKDLGEEKGQKMLKYDGRKSWKELH